MNGGSLKRMVSPPSALDVVTSELNRRVKRSVAKARRKQKEYKFQDERIHRARAAALAEVLEFVQELRRANG